MKAVWKFPLVIDGAATAVLMPAGAKIIHVEVQYGNPTLWAEVSNPAMVSKVERKFVVRGTGETFPEDNEYVGTVFDNVFVWHIYEVLS